MGRSSPRRLHLTDESLADEAAFLTAVLRLAADRWRRRLLTGHVSAHPTHEIEALVDTLDRAAGNLDPGALLPVGPIGAIEADDRYRLLLDSVRDYAIFMLDRDGNVASWNSGAERLTGWRAEEIVGSPFATFYPPEEVAAGRPGVDLRAAADDGRIEQSGLRVRKDGSRFRAHTILTAVRDGNGRLLGYSKITRDLTEHDMNEEALRRSEERFRLIVESVVDYAIFMLDADGRVATWNAGAKRIKGYDAAEIIGSPYARFFTPEDVAAGKPARALATAAAEGRWADEGWRVRKDGTRFYASIVLTALRDATGRLVGYGKVTRDYTDRLRAEQALRTTNEALEARSAALLEANRQLEQTNAQLEQANRELEWLSYALSHDLRAPLRKISAAATVLDRPERSPEERVQVDRLHGATRTIDQLIGGMLVLAGVRRAALAPQPIDLAPIARAVLEDLRASDPSRVVTCVVPATLPGHGDAALVRIILDNLLRNAWKFTSRATDARIEVGADGTGWFVRDNGAGFDMGRAQKLFTPFERLHRAADFDGTGIGLATVRAAVLRHGGAITADAVPGKGATFRFTLGPPTAG